jgi:hypothetical protein
MPIIIGVPRSGTTLLRFMLDAHPDLAIPPETGFLSENSARRHAYSKLLRAARLTRAENFISREDLFLTVTGFPFNRANWKEFNLSASAFRSKLHEIEPFDWAEGFRAFYRMYAAHQGKPRYGDKTPLYCEHIDAITQLLPEAHFIHILRDGRDVALSLRETWFAPSRDIKTLALYWQRLVQTARRAGRTFRPHGGVCGANYKEVRYEELLADPEHILHSICEFLQLDFHPAMLRYWERSADRLQERGPRHTLTGRILVTREQRLQSHRLTTQPPQLDRAFCWKKEMTTAEQAEFSHYAADTLHELGYEP